MRRIRTISIRLKLTTVLILVVIITGSVPLDSITAEAINPQVLFEASMLPSQFRSVSLPDSIGTKDMTTGHNPKLHSYLDRLCELYNQDASSAMSFADSQKLTAGHDCVQVMIKIDSETDIPVIRDTVESWGGDYQCHYGTSVQAMVPISSLESLAALSNVQTIRRPYYALPLGGSVDTEALGISGATDWHAAGLDGSGVKIAVIDGGFEGYTDLQSSGDLPPSVATYDWTGTGIGGFAHGAACAEIAYDMAPGASFYLHKAYTDVELGNAVTQAISDDVDIISLSLGWILNGPGDGTGSLADIVNDAHTNGIVFVASSGNSAESCWSGYFNDYGDGTHRFASGENVNIFGPKPGYVWYIPAGAPIVVGMHWDDWTAVNQDYDIHLLYFNPNDPGAGWQLVASSTEQQNGQVGQTPEELIAYDAPYDGYYGIAVEKYSASRNVCFRLIASSSVGLTFSYQVPQRSLAFPADCPNTLTVGALNVGSPSGPQERFSSQGPAFGTGGYCYDGGVKPDISGYDLVSTASYAPDQFLGTSSGAAHVAGAAALVKEAYPNYTADQIKAYLESSAVDLGSAGKDNLYGSGRLSLGALQEPEVITGPATQIGSSTVTLNGALEDLGSAGSVNVSFEYGTAPGSCSDCTTPVSMSSPGSFQQTVNIDMCTNYYFRVKAVGMGTVYGDEKHFTSTAEKMINSIIYVNSSASGSNTGTSWSDAHSNLGCALVAAGSGCEVWVAEGTYIPLYEAGGLGPRYRSFQMKNNVGIYGGFPSSGSPAWDQRDWQVYETILSGEIGNPGTTTDNCYHVFYHPAGSNLNNTAILDGFTIRGGNGNGDGDQRYGGGMYNGNSHPVLKNCLFSCNEADWGGGIYNSHSNPVMGNSTFQGNVAAYYGGGGVYNYFSNPALTNCTFYSNTADDYGGGIYNQSSSPRLTNCIFWNNTAPLGTNEIHTAIGTPSVTHCDIQGGYTGMGNIDLDPMFVNPGSGDFHLLPNSPCIDSGSNGAVLSTGISLDFEGDPRIINGKVDLGVDEYKGWSPLSYDKNENGKISYSEMIDALMDYLVGNLSYSRMIAVLMCYLTG